MTNSETALAIVQRFVAAMFANDLDAMRRCCSPSFAHWYNTSDREMTLDEMLVDNERLGLGLGANFTMTPRHRYAFANGVVSELTYGWDSENGPVRTHVCVVTTVDANGLIDRINEYVDSSVLPVA